MYRHDIIVIGASTGGVQALLKLVGGLPPGLAAALFVVMHLPDGFRSALPEILSRGGPLLARQPQDGEPVQYGRIYVAPPGRHMVLGQGQVHLTRGPRENHHRPAIDPLFRTAAREYGPRVVGVVLTGSLSDGAAGLMAIRNAGGVAIVQDPGEAFSQGMPRAAWEIAGADHVLPVADIAPLLVGMVREPVAEGGPTVNTDPIDRMPEQVLRDMAAQEDGRRQGQLSMFTCPECGGPL
jgi:two-component system chemotaxis response regulator CheB